MQADNRTSNDQEAVRSVVRLAFWTLAWVVTLALARFGPTNLWDSQPAASWAAVGLNLAVGVGWIVAHARYLRGIDELQRKIMLDALAVTFGVGWVGGFSYVVADAADLVTTSVGTGVFPALLGVVYMVAIVVSNVRYR